MALTHLSVLAACPSCREYSTTPSGPGFKEDAVLCRPPWPEVEKNVKEDPKNRVFSWIPVKWPIVRIRIDYGKKHHF